MHATSLWSLQINVVGVYNPLVNHRKIRAVELCQTLHTATSDSFNHTGPNLSKFRNTFHTLFCASNRRSVESKMVQDPVIERENTCSLSDVLRIRQYVVTVLDYRMHMTHISAWLHETSKNFVTRTGKICCQRKTVCKGQCRWARQSESMP